MRVVLLLTLSLLHVTALRGQDEVLRRRLDPATYEALRPVLDDARQDSLPVHALEAKALEGAAKRRPSDQIVATVGRFAEELRAARRMLREAVPHAALADGEVVAAAEARRQGARPEDVVAVRRSAPAGTPLEVPIALLGELVRREIPVAEAREVIEHLVVTNVSQQRMIEVLQRVDVALRVGAPPGQALGTALSSLGIPAPPQTPGRGRPPRTP